MVLGDVEETVTTVEVDEDTYEEIVRVSVLLLEYDPDISSHWNYAALIKIMRCAPLK